MKGILFKPDMIKAIVENRKTVTRRLQGFNEINEEPAKWLNSGWSGSWLGYCFSTNITTAHIIKPRYLPGETVYIKEAWQFASQELADSLDYDFGIKYSDGEILWWTDNGNEMNYPLDEKKRSPMFLPEKFARYFIKIKDVSPERLQEISPNDCLKEGIPDLGTFGKGRERTTYSNLWDSINKKTPWTSNPWVWRIEFERVEVSR